MTTALLLIDMQADMQARIDAGRGHANPDTAEHVAALAAGFRAAGRPVLHVRHAASDPASPFHPDAPGHAPMPCAEAAPGEAVFVKSTSSAFPSTRLEAHLRAEGIDEIVVAGAVAGFCVASTVRDAADRGFRMAVAGDAVLSFALPGLPAQTVLEVTLGLLGADFARIVMTREILAEV